jgi:class 3 adenylate cyclase
MPRIAPLTMLLLFPLLTRAQEGSASVRQAADSTRFRALFTDFNAVVYQRPDSAIGLALAMGELARRTKVPRWVALSDQCIGQAWRVKGRTQEALGPFQRALTAYERLGDRSRIAMVHANIANILVEERQWEKARRHGVEAVAGFQRTEQPIWAAAAMEDLAQAFLGLGMDDSARVLLQRAAPIMEAAGMHDHDGPLRDVEAGLLLLNDEDERARQLHRSIRRDTTAVAPGILRARILLDMGRALDTIGLAPRPDLMEAALLNIGTLHAIGQRFEAADTCYQAVLRSTRRSGNTGNTTSALLNLAGLAENRGDGRLALTLIDSVVAIASATRELELLANATLNLAEVMRKHGNKDSAFFTLQRHLALRDSILGLARVRAVADMEQKYESEKKAREIETLKVANLDSELARIKALRTRNIYLGVGLGVLALASALWGRLGIVHRSRAAIRKEKEISEGLLHNILPEEVAAELKAKGYADVREFPQATILFTDFKGFTQLTEQLSATELVAEIDHCFKAFDGLMERYRIEKIKTIGDAYMAAGGLPDPAYGSPADVVNAALDMQAFMAAYKAERIAQGRLFFEMRVGIHTGPVIAGIVGVKKFAYDIWGDTVNTASRMESSGAVGEVNISEATFALVQEAPTPTGAPAFTFTPRGQVQAKGKGELAMFFVRRSAPR